MAASSLRLNQTAQNQTAQNQTAQNQTAQNQLVAWFECLLFQNYYVLFTGEKYRQH